MDKNSVKLDPEMTALLDEFLEKIKGKSMTEMMPVLAEFKGRLPKDKVFSDEERDMIIEEALCNMTEDDRNRCKAFLKMVKII